MTTTTAPTTTAPPVATPTQKESLLSRLLRKKPTRYRVLVIEAQPFWLEMPLKEIRKRLDMNTFVQPERLWYNIFGTASGTVGGALLFIFLAAALINALVGHVPIAVAAFFGAPVGIMVGTAVGYWIIAPRLGPRPYFRSKRIWTVDKDGVFTTKIVPLYHSKLMLDLAIKSAQKRMALSEIKGGEGVLSAPPISRANTIKEIFDGRDEKEFFKGGLSGWQKVQIVAMVVAAIALAGLCILYAMTGMNGGTPNA